MLFQRVGFFPCPCLAGTFPSPLCTGAYPPHICCLPGGRCHTVVDVVVVVVVGAWWHCAIHPKCKRTSSAHNALAPRVLHVSFQIGEHLPFTTRTLEVKVLRATARTHHFACACAHNSAASRARHAQLNRNDATFLASMATAAATRQPWMDLRAAGKSTLVARICVAIFVVVV